MLPNQDNLHSKAAKQPPTQYRFADFLNQRITSIASQISFGVSPGATSCRLNGRTWLHCCLGVIALVSIHDAVLVVINHEIINEVERNPLGTWLLQLQDGQVWLFVTVKLIGTSVVTTSLVLLYEFRRHLGLTVATALSMLQCGLLFYLTFF